MSAKNLHEAGALYGETNRTAGVPLSSPRAALSSGPKLAQGALVLDGSFRCGNAETLGGGAPEDASVEPSSATGILESLENDYLADVLWVKECFEDAWVHEAPVVLRFESNDLVATPQPDGRIGLWVGQLDTAAPILSCDGSTEEGRQRNEAACLAWLPYAGPCAPIGSKFSVMRVLHADAAGGTAIELAFEEGQAIVLSNTTGKLHVRFRPALHE